MLARIKFVRNSYNTNYLTSKQVEELNEFLGEKVAVKQLKINSEGNPSSLSWRETFDIKDVERNSEYVLVQPTDAYEISDDKDYIVTLERFTEKFPSIEITIKGIPKAVGNDNTSLIEEMNKMAQKIEEAKQQFNKVVEFNQKCEVHVPNLGLLNINKLAYATNYCTVELQNLLYQGWRILTICPQSNQRRPDYILGMHISDLDKDVDVVRFEGNGEE